MAKERKFSYIERYAIWATHGQRCWLCTAPLLFEQVTIDHFFPKWLMEDDEEKAKILAEYSIPADFNIDDFENWLPAHAACNSAKGKKAPRNTPISSRALDQLIKKAPEAKKLAFKMAINNEENKIFSTLLGALEKKKIDRSSLRSIFERLFSEPPNFRELGDILILDNNYWILTEEVEKEGLCTCERPVCVSRDVKVYCYFDRKLPQWVTKKGLYHKCYDEIIRCGRCDALHKRGHIGRNDHCGSPYADQINQTDIFRPK